MGLGVAIAAHHRADDVEGDGAFQQWRMRLSSDWLSRAFPALRWWPRVNRDSLRADLGAGAIGAVLVLPQGIAFATLAGLPPQYGLYAAMVPAIVAALWGSSWHLVSGPTNAISLVVFATMAQIAEPGSGEYVTLVLTLSFIVGLIQLAIGLARLGVLVDFISHTVVVGFTAGAAMLIIAPTRRAARSTAWRRTLKRARARRSQPFFRPALWC